MKAQDVQVGMCFGQQKITAVDPDKPHVTIQAYDDNGHHYSYTYWWDQEIAVTNPQPLDELRKAFGLFGG
jgi:hypothetical protein